VREGLGASCARAADDVAAVGKEKSNATRETIWRGEGIQSLF